MATFRSNGSGAKWVIDAVWCEGDTPITTRLEQLEFLCFVSPMLRYLIFVLKEYIIPSNGRKATKLLVCENIPLVAWFMEQVLRHAYINVRVLHADLNQEQRSELVREFNDPDRDKDIAWGKIHIDYDAMHPDLVNKILASMDFTKDQRKLMRKVYDKGELGSKTFGETDSIDDDEENNDPDITAEDVDEADGPALIEFLLSVGGLVQGEAEGENYDLDTLRELTRGYLQTLDEQAS